MATTEPAAAGTVVSPGRYRCSNCGYVLSLDSSQSLPACPSCAGPGLGHGWEPVSEDGAGKESDRAYHGPDPEHDESGTADEEDQAV